MSAALIEILTTVSANIIAIVFLCAGWTKASRIETFATALRQFNLGPLHGTVAVGIPIVELVIGLAYAAGHRSVFLILATAALLSLFIFVAVYAIVKRRRIKCSCFGDRDEELGWGTIIRNLILFVLAVIPLNHPMSLNVLVLMQSWLLALCFILVYAATVRLMTDNVSARN